MSVFLLQTDKGQDRENVPEKHPSLGLKLVPQSETLLKETKLMAIGGGMISQQDQYLKEHFLQTFEKVFFFFSFFQNILQSLIPQSNSVKLTSMSRIKIVLSKNGEMASLGILGCV